MPSGWKVRLLALCTQVDLGTMRNAGLLSANKDNEAMLLCAEHFPARLRDASQCG